ncbi:MAG: hypothetical protein ABIY50_11675 [Ignavibacteria bacterium]
MLQHFNKITKDELKNFKKFVNSPYFNSNKNIVKLFDYLSSKYPDISEEHVSYAAISQNVFSKDQINQDGIRKLLSDFMKLMEDYFMHSYLQRDIVANRISMLNTLRERGFTKRFEMNMNDLFKSQKRLFQKNDIDYTNQSNLESQYFEYYKSRFRNEHAECLQNISDMRDFSFIFSKLHIFFEMYMNEEIGRKKFDKKFYNEIISFIETNKNTISKLHPNIYIIYLVLLMHDTLDDKFFFKLEDYLKKNEKRFTTTSLGFYYNYLISFCMLKINKGDVSFRKIAFELYKTRMDKNLFLIDNSITDSEFTSVVNTVIALKEFKWLEVFIEKYKDKLDPEFAKDIYNLTKAKIFFYKKDYDQVFEHLKNVEFKDAGYYFNSKFILARVYYDSKELDGLNYYPKPQTVCA